MKSIEKGLILLIPCFFFLGMTMMAVAASGPTEVQEEVKPAQEGDCQESLQEIISLLKAQNSKLSGELRRIQRQMSALRADLDKPGLQEIFAGVGYILGLFGVAAFMAARNRGKGSGTEIISQGEENLG